MLSRGVIREDVRTVQNESGRSVRTYNSEKLQRYRFEMANCQRLSIQASPLRPECISTFISSLLYTQDLIYHWDDVIIDANSAASVLGYMSIDSLG